MLEISKDEAKYIREHGGVRGLTRLMRQDSKRKHYYLCEDNRYVELLRKFRESQKVILTYGEV